MHLAVERRIYHIVLVLNIVAESPRCLWTIIREGDIAICEVVETIVCCYHTAKSLGTIALRDDVDDATRTTCIVRGIGVCDNLNALNICRRDSREIAGGGRHTVHQDKDILVATNGYLIVRNAHR